MAGNITQFEWIVYIKKGLDWLYTADRDVFVAGNLFWYPVEDDTSCRQAPDIFVVFGRPKGDFPANRLRDRGSYLQWLEEDMPPQVVFEVISPEDTIPEMTCKFQFYDRYGVEEYYIYDPDRASLGGFLRQDGELEAIHSMEGWVSPALKVGFGLGQDGSLELVRPNGQPFETYEQLAERAEQERLRAESAEQKIQHLQEQLVWRQDEINQLSAQLHALANAPTDKE